MYRVSVLAARAAFFRVDRVLSQQHHRRHGEFIQRGARGGIARVEARHTSLDRQFQDGSSALRRERPSSTGCTTFPSLIGSTATSSCWSAASCAPRRTLSHFSRAARDGFLRVFAA
jgi:hypothetical protein